jgi:transposase
MTAEEQSVTAGIDTHGRLRYHEPTRDYAQRRRAQGLSHKEIMRCLKRYVAREVHKALIRTP